MEDAAAAVTRVPLIPVNGDLAKGISKLRMPSRIAKPKSLATSNDDTDKAETMKVSSIKRTDNASPKRKSGDGPFVRVQKPKLDVPSTAKTSTNIKRKPLSTSKPSMPSASTKSTSTVTVSKRLTTAVTTSRRPLTTSSMSSSRKPPTKAPIKSATTKAKVKAVTDIVESTRKPWDLRGRLADMEVFVEQSKEQASTLKKALSRIEELEENRDQLQGSVQMKEADVSIQASRVDALQLELEDAAEEHGRAIIEMNKELTRVSAEGESVARELEVQQKLVVVERANVTALQATVAQITADSLGLQTQLSTTKGALNISTKNGEFKDNRILELEAELVRHLATIEEKEQRLREQETIRRQLHNSIQELKGNIRVFCRVRPLTLSEKEKGVDTADMIFDEHEEKGITIKIGSEANVSNTKSVSKEFAFSFDRIFQAQSTQTEVFGEISQLVQSALDGYNVCIFAYGQTGSGKTYTMEGDSENDFTRGMIPRSVEQIFTSAKLLSEKGWSYSMKASFLEIYNETIRDLLSDDTRNLDIKMSKANNSNKKGTSADVHVPDLTVVSVTNEDAVYKLLSKAARNRAVGATQANERSSRSHSVFMLKLIGTNSQTDEKSTATLNLIDLAGSERLNSSCAQGERLKETQNINKSLSNLGNVIMALANGDAHIPYRNSKLTFLLQNSLGGNSKTLMFVNVSPLDSSASETLCSLRFATKVNGCNIGTAKKSTSATTPTSK